MQKLTHPADARVAAPAANASQDEAYRDAMARHGRDLARFVTGYELDPAKRQELLQEVHLAVWQSLAGFRGQCSLHTWVYRVAHHLGASHVQRSLRSVRQQVVELETLEAMPGDDSSIATAERRLDVARLLALIHRLQPPDREVMLLYLEDLDAASIGEITGLSARNVATKVHRIKKLIASRLNLSEGPT